MTEERSELSLALARVLFVNGQATDQIIAEIDQSLATKEREIMTV